MSFLNDISIYNAAADFRISTASTGKASLWTGLKNTANDLTLSDDTRLRALTALITSAELLQVAISFSYPSTTSPVNPIPSGTVIHNDTVGLQGGSSTERYHSTFAQQTAWDNKASLSDITFANILGAVASNGALVAAFSAKQDLLSGNGLVRLAGSTLTYDNSVYLTNITGISAGGELLGTYPNPTLLNSAVIGKVLTGFTTSNTAIVGTDSIVVMAGKAQGQIDALSALAANSITALTGDVSATGPGSVAATISNNAVTFAKMQQIAQGFMGRSSVGTGTGELLTPTQATALLNTFSASLKGLVPSSIVADGTKVLYDDGTWAVPPASGSGSVTNVSGAGIASLFSLSITNPSTTPALAFALIAQSANRIFAGPTSGAAAAPTWRVLAVSDIPELPISQISGLQGELDSYLPDALANDMLFIGNVSDVAVNAIVTGDLTAAYVDNSGTNEAQFTIANEAVTYAKIQNVTSQTLLGRFALTDGVVQQLTLNGTDFTINSSTGVIGLATPNSPILTTKGDILTHTGAAQVRLGIGANATFFMADTAATTGNKWVAMSGDATIAVSGALTIANSAVTLAKMANLAANSFIGNNTGSAATPIALTVAQATAMLNLFSTSATTKGLVPGSNSVGATYYLDATGAWSVPAGGGGGGSGTVTSVSVVSANGFAGTVATATTTPAITLTTSITGLLKGNGTAISAATAGTDYLTSVGLTMPSAFTVTTSPLTANGTLAVTGAGLVSQYIRGDGSLANFPTSGGGGSSLSYYLNGSVDQGTLGGVAFKQMSGTPIIGGGTDFSISADGYIQSFITDASVPNQLLIPAGNWNFEMYFSANSGGGSPRFYIELYKLSGGTLTLIATSSANPEYITNGTQVDLYTTAVAVPSTVLLAADRLAIRVYVIHSSKTITLHTEDSNLCQVITTFSTGLTALNGLTAQVQSFANGSTGTAPAFVSSTATHTLNIPLASAASVTAGLISNTEFNTFNDKMSNPMTAEGDIIYGGTVTGGVAAPTRLAGQTTNGIYLLRANVTASAAVAPDWLGSTGSGNVVLATSPTIVTPTVTGIATFGNGTSAGEIRLLEGSGSGTNFVALKSPATLGADLSLTFPNTTPGSGQTLVSDGSGVLSWSSNPGTTNSQYRRAYGGTVVNTTPETFLQSILIPANTFTDGVGFQVMATTSRTNPGSNAVTFRMYINTSSAIGGVALSGTGYSNAAAAGTSSFHFTRLGFIQIASGGSRNTIFVPSTGSTNYALPGGTLSSSAIDWSVDQYFVLSVSQTSAVSTVTCNSLQLIPQ